MQMQNPLDPGTPPLGLDEWIRGLGQDPGLGYSLLHRPDQAAELLAAKGVPPPMAYTGQMPPGMRQGGAELPTPQNMPPQAQPSMPSQPAPQMAAPEAAAGQPAPEPSGSYLDPNTPQSAAGNGGVGGAPLDMAGGGMAPQGSPAGGLGAALQGLKALAPPTAPAVGTPAAPHPDPRGLQVADPLKAMQMMHTLSAPGIGPLLAQLLGRGG